MVHISFVLSTIWKLWLHHWRDASISAENAGKHIVRPLTIIFERSWRPGEVPEDWKKANITPAFRTDKKEKELLSSSQPHFHPWKGEGITSFWSTSLSTWMTGRWSGWVSMNSLKVNHACPTWLPSAISTNNCLYGLREEQGTSSGLILARLLTLPLTMLSQGVWPGEVDCDAAGEPAEQHIPEGLLLWSVVQGLTGSLSLVVCPRAQYWAQYCWTASSITWMKGFVWLLSKVTEDTNFRSGN